MTNSLWMELPRGGLEEVRQVELCGQIMEVRPSDDFYHSLREVLSPLWLSDFDENMPEIYGDEGGDLVCVIGLSQQGLVLDNGLTLAGELTLPLCLALVSLASRVAREDTAEQLTKGFVATLQANVPRVAQRLRDRMLD